MKLSRSSISSTLVAAIFLTGLLAYATPAFAFEGTPSVTLEGHEIQDPTELWWIGGLRPSAVFSSDNTAGLPPTTGFYYEVDRSPGTIPDLSSDSCPVLGPLTETQLDIAGLAVDHPEVIGGGISRPEEGLWYIHLRSYIATIPGFSDATALGRFAVDLTPPAPILGLNVGTRLYTETTRRRLTWRDLSYELHGAGWEWGGGYDSLSGDDRWKLTVNGTPYVWDRYLYSPVGVATIETGLHPGTNVVTVQVIDHAGNESPAVKGYIYIDPDYPTVNLLAPSAGEGLHGTYDFLVSASDAAGVAKIVFKLDGIVKQSSSTARTFRYDTRYLSQGFHRLEVSVTDVSGLHTRTVVRDFYVDNTPIRISSVSDSPDPFFPMIHDGIKDTTTVNAYLGETASDLYLQVYDNTATELVREYHWQNVRAGWVKCGWDGKNAAGSLMDPGPMPSSATFKYRLVAKDRGGNWTTTGFGTTTIRNYDVIPNPSGGVKVVPR